MRRNALRRPLAALALAAFLGGSGCAHHRLTERQITIGIVTGLGIGLAGWLLYTACGQSTSSCEEQNRPGLAPAQP